MSKYQKYYRRGQAKARASAIEFQACLEGYTDGAWPAEEDPRYWWAMSDWAEHFRKVGKRFGLLREFTENAII